MALYSQSCAILAGEWYTECDHIHLEGSAVQFCTILYLGVMVLYPQLDPQLAVLFI